MTLTERENIVVLLVDTTARHIGKGIEEELLFGIRLLGEEKQAQITKPYQAMGKLFAEGDGFLREEAKKFTGPEYLPLPMRLLMGLIHKTLGKKMFQKVAASWGCSVPLDEKVWETSRQL